MTKPPKRNTALRIGILVREKHEYGYYHLEGAAVSIGLTTGEIWRIDHCADLADQKVDDPYDKIRLICESVNGLDFDSLTIISQGNNDDNPRHLYGWDLRYRDVGYVDRQRADSMSKTLGTLARKLDQYNRDFGRPATFGAYLARVARAIGAKTFVFPNAGPRYHEEYRRVEIGSGVWMVDQLVQQWIDAGKTPIAQEQSA
jgi:hypothetical protein